MGQHVACRETIQAFVNVPSHRHLHANTHLIGDDAHMSTHTHTHTCILTNTNKPTHTSAHNFQQMHTDIHTQAHIDLHICVYHTYAHMHVHTHTYTYTHSRTHPHRHTHKHTHTHTHTHTLTHMHAPTCTHFAQTHTQPYEMHAQGMCTGVAPSTNGAYQYVRRIHVAPNPHRTTCTQ
jgi:hypothetical protein